MDDRARRKIQGSVVLPIAVNDQKLHNKRFIGKTQRKLEPSIQMQLAFSFCTPFSETRLGDPRVSTAVVGMQPNNETTFFLYLGFLFFGYCNLCCQFSDFFSMQRRNKLLTSQWTKKLTLILCKTTNVSRHTHEGCA